MPRAQRPRFYLPMALLLIAAFVALKPTAALASGNQETIFEAEQQIHANPAGTLDLLRSLGVSRVRVGVPWPAIAPSARSTHRPNFDATDPAAYPAGAWTIFDTIVQDAAARGMGVDFTLGGGAPLWATGSGFPGSGPRPTWKPSAREFGLFVRAIGTRYRGNYTPPGSSGPLPAVRYWAIWNEPNYGQDLSPQATNHSTIEVAPALYRGLVDAAWSALHTTGHASDTFLFGEIAPRGLIRGDVPGNFGGMVPLRFLRALYCVDSSYAQLRGRAASARSCPTNAAGSRAFRSAHPALFQSTGFADHPYAQAKNPVTQTWPYGGTNQYTDLPQLPVLFRVLDRLQRIYGSHTRFNVYSTEYGYRTNPPERGQPNPTTAAVWLNWGEYLSWRNSRVSSFMQYLLTDPVVGTGFPSGLESRNGTPKATFDAFRLPLYLPSTSTRHGRSLEVWGCVRPAHFAAVDSGQPQTVAIEYKRGSRGSFSPIKTVSVGGRGYFDVRITFPASGSVRLAWSDPFNGKTDHSRTQSITIR